MIRLAVVQTVVLCMSTSCVPLCLFPIYRTRAVYEHVQTQNRQLADREEIFDEFDKKCIGLELQTPPFKEHRIIRTAPRVCYQYSLIEIY